VQPLKPGEEAPEVPGVDRSGPLVLFFYKVTCPSCQISAPVAERFHQQVGERFVGIGQDPDEKLEGFAQEYGTTFSAISDAPPYALSDEYGIRTVPTVFVLQDGSVVDVVESWDRDGWNRVAAKAGELVGTPASALSWEGDGLPPFRPG
jgi:thiol-disulfide isomerase/thioredoxin